MEIDAREEETSSPPVNKWLFNPATKKPVDPDDVDGLITVLEVLNFMQAKFYTHKNAIEDAIFAHCPKNVKTKTRRVKGEKRTAVITMPSDSQDSDALKAIAEDKKFRVIWKQLVRIASYSVKMKEYKKALATKGTKEWNEYRDRVKAAIRPPTARPRIKVEE